MTVRHKPMTCKECGYVFDASTSATGKDSAVPHEGDLSVCLNCGAAMVYENEEWRGMTFDEIVDLDPSHRALLFKVQAAQRKIQERRKQDG